MVLGMAEASSGCRQWCRKLLTQCGVQCATLVSKQNLSAALTVRKVKRDH